jgi:hypothetical protein
MGSTGRSSATISVPAAAVITDLWAAQCAEAYWSQCGASHSEVTTVSLPAAGLAADCAVMVQGAGGLGLGGAGLGGAGLGGDGLSDIGAPLIKSVLLQPFAVNLINANKASDKIPIFLIGEAASARGPSKLARRFWMIRVIDPIAFNSGIRRKSLSLIN